jgi:hypothetical protein
LRAGSDTEVVVLPHQVGGVHRGKPDSKAADSASWEEFALDNGYQVAGAMLVVLHPVDPGVRNALAGAVRDRLVNTPCFRGTCGHGVRASTEAEDKTRN